MGLFALPLLASVVVAGAARELVNKFADHQLKTGIHDKIGRCRQAERLSSACSAGATVWRENRRCRDDR